MLLRKLCLLLILLFSIVSCAKRIVKPNLPISNCPPVTQPAEVKPQVSENKPLETVKVADYSLLKLSKWEDIDGLQDDDLSAAWPAWQQSCSTLINKAQWKAACTAAKIELKPSSAEVIAYLKNYFDVYSAMNADGSNIGLITGYYEPLLKGSRKKSEQYPYPLYRQPKDLITVELGDVYPELKYKRVRGKLVSNKLVPYNTRAEIEANPSPLEGTELLWVDDIIDVFFLQIQGSGLVKLDDGQEIQVGYADQNGHPYNSIGRILIERGELTADQASMQGIKTWARSHLEKLRDLLNSNPSYVFFKELPTGLPGPLGALGVPLSAERSLAIDQKYLPLGAPVFLSTNQPNSSVSLKRLMVAQDTGGAIKGGVRADFFWGTGDLAGTKAGAMKQSGKMWVLLPKDFKLSQPN